jgi:uncharacterized protein YecE (DUF72 family)
VIGDFRIGTSGWNYDHWRGRFYPRELPASRWFEYYSKVFDTVEINNTFYQLPAAKTFDHWREQAPLTFVYAVKANRFLTHMKKLKDPAQPLRRFFSRARRLREHLGPILYQLPPNWKRNVERLGKFCDVLPGDLTHVFEFRDSDWLAGETFATLESHGACLCVHDLLDRHPRRVTGPAAYVRFHGSGQLYSGRYPRDQLRRWADWMRDVASHDRRVFAYFNNDAEGNAVRDAMALRKLLQR